MPVRSAGLMLFRRHGELVEVLLVHPGGPFWAKKDLGAWSIPKGEYGGPDDPPGEVDPIATARREFAEELGAAAPAGELFDLGEVRLKSGKYIRAWAVEGDLDVTSIRSNTFETAWPPRSGRRQEFPEVDRAEWFDPDEARQRLNPAQAAFVDRLLAQLAD